MNSTSGSVCHLSLRFVYSLWVVGLGSLHDFLLLCVTEQSTFGSVRGTVQDTSGAALPNADVTLHSEGENNDRS